MTKFEILKAMTSNELFDLAEQVEQELMERIQDGRIAKSINSKKDK